MDSESGVCVQLPRVKLGSELCYSELQLRKMLLE